VGSPKDFPSMMARFNKLPKWARDYVHQVRTFSGAKEVEELTQLRDHRRQLIKLVAELKVENRTLRRKIDSLIKVAP
jgi:hypothetical protein